MSISSASRFLSSPYPNLLAGGQNILKETQAAAREMKESAIQAAKDKAREMAENLAQDAVDEVDDSDAAEPAGIEDVALKAALRAGMVSFGLATDKRVDNVMATEVPKNLPQDAMEEVMDRAADASGLVEAPNGLVDLASEVAEHHAQEIIESAAAGAGGLASGPSGLADLASPAAGIGGVGLAARIGAVVTHAREKTQAAAREMKDQAIKDAKADLKAEVREVARDWAQDALDKVEDAAADAGEFIQAPDGLSDLAFGEAGGLAAGTSETVVEGVMERAGDGLGSAMAMAVDVLLS